MILNPSKTEGSPEDGLPADVPPSYDTIVPKSASAPSYRDEKASYPPTSSSSISPGPSSSSSSSFPRQTPLKNSGSSCWFNFGMLPTARDSVYSTVSSLIRELVNQPSPIPGAGDILDSCSESCRAFGISFASLLQEKSIESHTPLYWAIIKRPSGPLQPGDFVTTLLSRAAPLTSPTISEIRHACLLASDQALFQRLRLSPGFSPLSVTNQMILGTSTPPDTIEVQDVEGDEGNFMAYFEILAFQKRMRVSNNIELEFIARGRMWCLAFSVNQSSKWVVKLSILKYSPTTWVDAHVIIEEAPRPSITQTAPSLIESTAIPHEQSAGQRGQKKGKPKPVIDIRLHSRYSRLTPNKPIIEELEDTSEGSSLQYDGSSYLDAEGTLRVKLTARLAKPN